MYKKNRIPAKDFTRTIQKGQLYKSKNFFIRVRKNNKGFIRTGVAVSKKLTPTVVKKNYYKRVARHILRDILTNTDKEKSYDIILIIRETAKQIKFDQLKKEADELLHETKLKN